MDNTKVLGGLLFLLMIQFDIIIISSARRHLLDFLIGRKNKKSARKIHSEQTFKNRINMGYIYPMLKKYQKTFKKFHTLYLSILYSLIPQYIVGVLSCFFVPNIAKYIIGVLLGVRLLLTVFYRLELGPHRQSVYAQKK